MGNTHTVNNFTLDRVVFANSRSSCEHHLHHRNLSDYIFPLEKKKVQGLMPDPANTYRRVVQWEGLVIGVFCYGIGPHDPPQRPDTGV